MGDLGFLLGFVYEGMAFFGGFMEGRRRHFFGFGNFDLQSSLYWGSQATGRLELTAKGPSDNFSTVSLYALILYSSLILRPHTHSHCPTHVLLSYLIPRVLVHRHPRRTLNRPPSSHSKWLKRIYLLLQVMRYQASLSLQARLISR